jgi:pimeloyl-ACP methyl ester carboxylesterase
VIAAAAGFIRTKAFIRPEGMVMVGHSAGGWGVLPLASEEPRDVAAIIAFAPGRGGHANDVADRVCAPHTLLAAAAAFGKAARVKVTWLVAAKQLFFTGRRQLDTFHRRQQVDFGCRPLAAGAQLPETEAGVKLAEPELDRA